MLIIRGSVTSFVFFQYCMLRLDYESGAENLVIYKNANFLFPIREITLKVIMKCTLSEYTLQPSLLKNCVRFC